VFAATRESFKPTMLWKRTTGSKGDIQPRHLQQVYSG